MEGNIVKALEVWTLTTLLDLSVLLGYASLAVEIAHAYRSRLENDLTLRVSREWWSLATTLVADLLLAGMAGIGLLLVNPDVMCDIKMAVPFYPIAVFLAVWTLAVRLVGGGRRMLGLLVAANLLNLLGYTLVMEAPGGEYLEVHPSQFWTWVKMHLRSNASVAGMETAYISFWIAFAGILIVLGWALWRGIGGRRG